MIELLNIDCMQYMATQPDSAFDLAIVDPPYFEVKGEFDYKWASFDDYLRDVESWAVSLKRILKDSGHFFWWGNSKKIAYTQIILDKYFNLENSMIWEKKDSIQYQYYSPDLARCFNTHNERVLYYSCEVEMTGRDLIEREYIAPQNPFALYLRGEFKAAGITNKEISELFPSRSGGLTGCVSNWLSGANVITEEQYITIRGHLNGEYLRREYEDLRREYEDLRRPFNNELKTTEVLSFSQQSEVTRKYKHPTQKSPKLTEALVLATSRKGGMAFIPFAGSGTELIECHKAGMNVVGCEIDADYFKMAKERVDLATRQEQMF